MRRSAHSPTSCARADLIVLLGKALDFTTRWASGAAFDPAVRLIAIDPEAALVERAAKEMDGRLVLGAIADIRGAAETLIARAGVMKPRDGAWLTEARAALDNRPAAWTSITSQTPGRLHPGASVPRAAPLRGTRSRHGSHLRRRRVRPMGPEHASGAAAHDQRRRGLDRRLALVRERGAARRAEGAGVRRARRRHDRLPSLRVRNRGAAQAPLRRRARQ